MSDDGGHPLIDAARMLLAQGDAAGAERLIAPLVKSKTAEASTLHLMAMACRAQNRTAETERYLRAAIAGALTEGNYYNDLAVIVQARGRYDEAERLYQAAIALSPDPRQARFNLVRCISAAGRHGEAETAARALIESDAGPEASALLAHTLTAQQRYDEAALAAEAAWRAAPKSRLLRHNLAIALDRAGRIKDSLVHLSALAQDGIETPELAVNLARALQHEDRLADAEAVLVQAVEHWPQGAAAHNALARLRWIVGAGAEATLYLEKAIEAHPDDSMLRLTCADILHRAGFYDRAGRILEDGLARTPDSPALLSSMGVVLDDSGRIEEALALLRRATALTPGALKTHRNLIPTLLRGECVDEALEIIRAIRKVSPHDQEMIAYEATALRMLGDPSYHVLFDYARMVQIYDLAPPRGFFSIENFNASLSESVRAEFKAQAHPLDQTLRHGQQSGRNLALSRDVNVQAFLDAVRAPVQTYIDALLSHPQDPVGMRKGAGFKIVNCWASVMRNGGYHVNHVHQNSWLSATYYVETPGEMERAPNKAGWLQFGEPRLETPRCGPEKFVAPKPGRMVVYPSYLWHGTIPFIGAGERLALSFDVVPT